MGMLRPATDMATAMDMATARGLPRLSPAMATAMVVMDMAMARGLPRLSPAMATAMVVMDMATARGLPMLNPATDMAMAMATMVENISSKSANILWITESFELCFISYAKLSSWVNFSRGKEK